MVSTSGLKKSLFSDNPILEKPSAKKFSGAWNALKRDEPELMKFADEMYMKDGLEQEAVWIMERLIDTVISHNQTPNTAWWTVPRSIDERVSSNIELFYCQKYASIVAAQCGIEGSYNVDCLKNNDKISYLKPKMSRDTYWKGLATLTIVSQFIEGGNSIFYDLDCFPFIEWAGTRDDLPEVVRVILERKHIDVGNLQAVLEDGEGTPTSLHNGML